MKQYFDDLDEALEGIAIKQLDLPKTQGFNAVKKLVGLPYGFLVLRPMLKKNLRAKALVRAGNQCH